MDGYDVILSSHIINFMKWVPMLSDENPELDLMTSIDNIIAAIRDEVYDKIRKTKGGVRSKAFINSRKSLFLRDNNVDLRKALIKAMYDEPGIHLQFNQFFGSIAPLSERQANQ